MADLNNKRTRRQGRRQQTVAAVPALELDDDDVEEVEEAPAPKRAARRPNNTPKAETVAKATQDVAEANGDLADMFDEMESGIVYTVVRNDDNTWTVTAGGAQVQSQLRPVRGAEYDDTVLSDEYKAWRDEWQELGTEEKIAKVKKAKVEWKHNDHAATDMMWMVEAYLAHLGIEKYKPEYQTRAARTALRKGYAVA